MLKTIRRTAIGLPLFLLMATVVLIIIWVSQMVAEFISNHPYETIGALFLIFVGGLILYSSYLLGILVEEWWSQRNDNKKNR